MSIEEMKQQIIAVVNALDRVTVCGYQNLCNLQGSISVLKTIATSDFSDVGEKCQDE